MIAVNASTSPHSNVSFTPFGSDALTFAGEGSGRFLSAFRGSSSPNSNSSLAAVICTGIKDDVEDGGDASGWVCFRIHFQTRFALTPCSRASFDTDAPGSRQAAIPIH